MFNQKNLIEKFRSINNFPTYEEISIVTGIDKSRIFRIFNGHEMKRNELEIFIAQILEKDPFYLYSIIQSIWPFKNPPPLTWP